MCWHILALFYVVSVRYAFYITYSSQSSYVLSYLCISILSVSESMQYRKLCNFQGDSATLTSFYLQNTHFLFCNLAYFENKLILAYFENLLIFVWAVESKLQQVSVLGSAEQLSDPYLQVGSFVSQVMIYILFKLSTYKYLKWLPISLNFCENLLIFLAYLYRDKILIFKKATTTSELQYLQVCF